jgi:hypothetical protein
VKYINKYHFSYLKSQPEEIVDEGEKVEKNICLGSAVVIRDDRY